MTVKLLLEYVNISDLIISISLVLLLWRKRKMQDFALFAVYLGCRIAASCVSIPLLYFHKELGIPSARVYQIYLGTYWIFFIAQAVLQALTIYGIYRLAMRPLQGLQRIGQIIFRWVAGVSFGLSVFFAIGPHTGDAYWPIITTQIHQGVSVLSLCLLLFVCLAIRPLGLTFRSHIFGVSLGLGVTSATTLIVVAWGNTASGHSLFSPVYLIGGTASVAALLIWVAYFAAPEPERRMVLLPTTSPFFVWNSISEALGDEPGYVAVSGFTPDMLAPAELEELSRFGHKDEFSEDDESDDDEGGSSDPPRSFPFHSLVAN